MQSLPTEILVHPNPFLRTKCATVTKFGEGLQKKVDKLKAAIQATENGVGLAAPQIGIIERFFIITVDGELLLMVNPEIVDKAGELTYKEGCLSVPGMYYNIKRAAEVTVKYQDIDGNKQSAVFEGMEAVEVQHECDHLDGILFIDHLPGVHKSQFQKKYKVMIRKLKRAGYLHEKADA